jgi:hypothetical protein
VSVASHRVTRANLLLVAGAWAWVMICIGPRLVLELPGLIGVSSRWLPLGCAGFIASGVFIFIWSVGRCFPLASPKVKLSFELLPWFGLAGFALGGLI